MAEHHPEHGGLAHRILERLTAVKSHIWLLRRRLRGGAVDPAEAAKHLDEIEGHVDEAAALAANLQGEGNPPP